MKLVSQGGSQGASQGGSSSACQVIRHGATTVSTAGRVTTLWVEHPLSVNQQGRLSLPSLWGRLNE